MDHLAMAAKPGAMLTEQLRLLKPIGAGAMGSVWLAEDLELERRVAIKLIGGALNAQAVARFRREASLAAKIKSPHVVQIYGHGVSQDGEPYIEMELLDGESLASHLDAGRLALEEAREIVAQVARALTAAHALGVVHRDIKPGNVFLVDAPGYDVFVKVVDFGIAKQRSDATSALTATGAVVGTPFFMSPEQLTSTKDVDHRADLWALAVVAYQMLTARLPFEGDTVGAVSVAVSKGVFEPVSKQLGASSERLDAWFERAFRFDMEDRFQSAEELSAAFGDACRRIVEAPTVAQTSADESSAAGATSEFIADKGLSVSTDHPAPVDAPPQEQDAADSEPPPTAGAPSRSRAWLWAVAALALLGTGLFALRPPAHDTSVVDTAPSPSPSGSAVGPSVSAAAWASTRSEAKHQGAPQGRLPPGYIQEVMRTHFDALTGCLDVEDAPKWGLIRTVRFVIQPDGTTRDVHVAELDPRTETFDACLVSKVQAMGFAPPDGGTVTVAYPLTFTDDDRLPLDDAACRMTASCQESGFCSAQGDKCSALRNGDCALSRLCVRRGQCSAVDGHCVAGSVGGPDTPACRSFGLCSLVEGRARAEHDEDCRRATVCGKFGACAARGGVCVSDSNDACSRSWSCETLGACVSNGTWCLATDDERCRRSERCASRGACSLRYVECVPLHDEDCRSSTECKEYGKCTARFGRCLATSEEDCRKSTRCTERGHCVLVGDQCAQPRP